MGLELNENESDLEEAQVAATNALESHPSGFKATADGLRDVWLQVIRAPTVEDFDKNWNRLCAEFYNQQREINIKINV